MLTHIDEGVGRVQTPFLISSDLEVEREIQAATNAFGALLPKFKMHNAAVLPSPLNSFECSSRS